MLILFHGACYGCTQQEDHSTDFCYDCCYFDSKWEKPSLNNRPLTEVDRERERIKQSKKESAMFVYYPVCFCNGKPMVRSEDNPGLWRCSECGAKRDSNSDKAGAWRIIKVPERGVSCG